MKIQFSVFCSLLLLPLVSLAGELEVTNAWVSSAPPVARSQAAYMTLTNTSGQEVRLAGVEAEGFDMVMLHRSWLDGDVARMEHVDMIELGSGESVSLEPGGYHIMLMGPDRVLEVGESALVELIFADGSRQKLEVSVKEAVSSKVHSHHSHHDHH
jgi:copper(I)-binding protein